MATVKSSIFHFALFKAQHSAQDEGIIFFYPPTFSQNDQLRHIGLLRAFQQLQQSFLRDGQQLDQCTTVKSTKHMTVAVEQDGLIIMLNINLPIQISHDQRHNVIEYKTTELHFAYYQKLLCISYQLYKLKFTKVTREDATVFFNHFINDYLDDLVHTPELALVPLDFVRSCRWQNLGNVMRSLSQVKQQAGLFEYVLITERHTKQLIHCNVEDQENARWLYVALVNFQSLFSDGVQVIVGGDSPLKVVDVVLLNLRVSYLSRLTLLESEVEDLKSRTLRAFGIQDVKPLISSLQPSRIKANDSAVVLDSKSHQVFETISVPSRALSSSAQVLLKEMHFQSQDNKETFVKTSEDEWIVTLTTGSKQIKAVVPRNISLQEVAQDMKAVVLY